LLFPNYGRLRLPNPGGGVVTVANRVMVASCSVSPPFFLENEAG
jgi:hypothetical protein